MAQAQKPKLRLRRLEKLLNDFSRVRLAVVGDVLLDEYLRGDVQRISPEAPVPVVHVQGEAIVLGGAGNVVRNVVSLGAGCEFSAVVGLDADGERVISLLEELGVDARGVIQLEGRPTTRKTRVVARSQQIVRVDRETREAISKKDLSQWLERLPERLHACDAAVIADYGKGMLVKASIRKILACCKSAKLPVSVDPKSELQAYTGAALLKPNLREAEQLTGVSAAEKGGLDRIAKKFRAVVGDADLVITRGGSGMSLFANGEPRWDVATSPQEVFDVQGAGDTTIAVLALARAAGANLVEAAVLANAAASVVVEKTGTATANRDEVAARLPSALAAARKGFA